MNTSIAMAQEEAIALEQEVSKALLVMEAGLANPKPVTKHLVRLWVMVLAQAGIQAHEVSPTTARMLLEEKFFPTPADFIRHARPVEDRDAASELAWQRVLKLIAKFGGNASLCLEDAEGDGALLYALDVIGWERICAELTEGDEHHGGWTKDTRLFFRSEFKSAYRAASGSKRRLEYVAGRLAIANRRHTDTLTPALCGRPDWTALPPGAASGPTPDEAFDALPFASLKALIAGEGATQ